jgi:nucleotide-binding universal stress UspA family protein
MLGARTEARPFKILVAFDDTPASWAAVREASNIARRLGGTLTIVHAAQPRLSSFDGPVVTKRALEIARGDAECLLAEAQQTVDNNVPTTTEVLSGDPADAVVRRAAELGTDLIVVGSQRRGGLERLMFGSVSEAIVRRATAPVLLTSASARDRAIDAWHAAASGRSDSLAAA